MTDKSPDDPSVISFVLEDDSKSFRLGLSSMFADKPGMRIVRVAASGREALPLPAAPPPDIVLLDLHLPDMLGLELIARLRARWPQTQVIILTGDDSATHRAAALAAGAAGYVAKARAATELIPTTTRVMNNRTGV